MAATETARHKYEELSAMYLRDWRNYENCGAMLQQLRQDSLARSSREEVT